MESDRLKALTDGVVAVVLTIMVLELKAPETVTIGALIKLAPIFLSYVVSFVYVAIYWNNHHHFYTLTPRVTSAIMWANFHLLFWLSLIPFATAWVSEHPFAPLPVAVYGVVLLACAMAWAVMQFAIISAQGAASTLRLALAGDWKGKISPVIYLAGIGLSYVEVWIALILYAGVAVMWLIPDRRVQRFHGNGSVGL